jgi:hypothetical protein
MCISPIVQRLCQKRKVNTSCSLPASYRATKGALANKKTWVWDFPVPTSGQRTPAIHPIVDVCGQQEKFVMAGRHHQQARHGQPVQWRTRPRVQWQRTEGQELSGKAEELERKTLNVQRSTLNVQRSMEEERRGQEKRLFR